MRLAILNITPEALTGLLQLPEGAEVVDVVADGARRGVLQVKIQGAGWETELGSQIQHTTGTVTRDGERITIDWGFPVDSQE